MSDEVTSTRDDPELKAMLAIVRYLEPLYRAACVRVLKWAEQRYTELFVADGDLKAFQTFTDSLVEAAKQIGDVRPIDIIRFADTVREQKDARDPAL